MAMNELYKMTAHQVKEGNFNKAILAVGSCEAHGQHIAERDKRKSLLQGLQGQHRSKR